MLSLEPYGSIVNGEFVPDPLGRWIAAYRWSREYHQHHAVDSSPLVAAAAAVQASLEQLVAVERTEQRRREAAEQGKSKGRTRARANAEAAA